MTPHVHVLGCMSMNTFVANPSNDATFSRTLDPQLPWNMFVLFVVGRKQEAF